MFVFVFDFGEKIRHTADGENEAEAMGSSGRLLRQASLQLIALSLSLFIIFVIANECEI